MYRRQPDQDTNQHEGGNDKIDHPKDILVHVQSLNHRSNSDVPIARFNGFRLARNDWSQHSNSIEETLEFSGCHWDGEEKTLLLRPEDFDSMATVTNTSQGNVIWVLRLGFDFECNPVCFVATAEGLAAISNPDPDIRFSTRLRPSVLDEPGPHIRFRNERVQQSSLEWLHWDPRRLVKVVELDTHTGLWAFKGDRLNGLYASLWSRSPRARGFIGDSKESGTFMGSVDIIRTHWNDRLIWDVHLKR
ncbi:MAG: hypothetical protein L6R41_000397 [Letrouitia leprolyta]|nr:MAG: hypothetical protein L6R41_000397 [Letrouitia leprolyta]